MTRRPEGGSGRTTEPTLYDPEFDQLPSLRKRSPLKFWAIMIAAGAMVLVSMSGILAVIFS